MQVFLCKIHAYTSSSYMNVFLAVYLAVFCMYFQHYFLQYFSCARSRCITVASRSPAPTARGLCTFAARLLRQFVARQRRRCQIDKFNQIRSTRLFQFSEITEESQLSSSERRKMQINYDIAETPDSYASLKLWIYSGCSENVNESQALSSKR